MKGLILIRLQNRADRFLLKKNEVGQSVTSYLNKTAEKAVPCCTLVVLGMQTICIFFKKEIGFIVLIIGAIICIIY